MARRYDQMMERKSEIGLLGKSLARRAGRKCEWCEATEDLRPYDIAPKEDPDLDHLALFCERCRAVADGRKDDPRTLRFLEGAVWNEVTAVGETARKTIATVDADWARDTLDILG